MKQRLLTKMMVFVTLCSTQGAFSLPRDSAVVAGEVIFEEQENQLDIEQLSDKAIVEYSDFSIAENEQVNISQPGIDSVILNRVVGENLSEIYGSLNANGHVFLINPSGILLGGGGHVDVGSLTLTTFDIDNEEFLSGEGLFRAQEDGGKIRIEGDVHANNAVVVLSGGVENSGTIEAKNIDLLTGKSAFLIAEGSEIPIFA